MNRGDLVRIALQGDFGKPRPALIIQSDAYANHPSITILPLTSDVRNLPAFRIPVAPDKENGLKVRSDVMVDKASTIAAEKVGPLIGRLSKADMIAVERALALFLGFA